jgi:hypothetical protein
MVKNKKGGSGHKKLARKNVKETFRKRKLRKATINGEVYAKVVKINGGGMFDVMCFNDKKTRLLIVRKKFKGRNKRDNFISLNSILLVGLREWSVVSSNKKEKVDLLYIYTKNQHKELMDLNEIDSAFIIREDEDCETGFDITKEEDIEYEFSLEKTDTTNTKLETLEDVDWDDI